MSRAQEYEEKIRFHLAEVNSVQPTNAFRDLQKWQAQRLKNTHIELYRQSRFRPAMDFFKDDLYSAEHFQQRNNDIIKALPIMCSTMPESVLAIVEQAAKLHALSLELDILMLHFLGPDPDFTNLTMEQWVHAYRKSDNQRERDLQLDLIEQLGNELARVVKKPIIGSLLRWAKLPARLAGYQSIHQFVCSGFYAFEHLENAQDFLVPVITTERELSKTWFSS
jgi:hypothetical protein